MSSLLWLFFCYFCFLSGAVFNDNNNICYLNSDLSGSNAKPGKPTDVDNISDMNTEIVLMPNPATDYIDILNITRAKYIITNSMGQEISSGDIEKGSSSINVDKIEPGIYFITINGKEEFKKLKFVKI